MNNKGVLTTTGQRWLGKPAHAPIGLPVLSSALGGKSLVTAKLGWRGHH